MNITSVQIRNFRGIKHLDLDLGNTTVLIGENNTGKTSVLDALKLCLRDLSSRRRVVFDPLDFHLPDKNSEPLSAAPIEINVKFSERSEEKWDEKLIRRLERQGILQVDAEGTRQVHLQVDCRYDSATREFVHDWRFLDQNEQVLDGVPRTAYSIFREQFHYYYLTALRDASRHFDSAGPFWRPFLRDSQLSDEVKAEIESKLRDINSEIISSHASFEKVQNRLHELQHLVLLASEEVVSIEAVPNRMRDILSRAQVQIGAKTGAMIPLARHGEGTQSLAVLMLFSAFLESQGKGAAILALEEPEAHLHPSAIHVLWKVLRTYASQRLISTHSGELVAEVDIRNIRRLAQLPEGISVFRVDRGLLSSEESRKFKYQIRRTRGELLFARCWLLVEGETEAWVYPAAAVALGWNFHEEGIRIVEYQQSDPGMLIKVAKALGISWFCVGDDDGNREKVENKVRPFLGGVEEPQRLVFPYPNPETNLLRNGFEYVYRPHMAQNLRKIKKALGDPGYWEEYAINLPNRAKTRAAADVAIELERSGAEGVTQEIRSVLERVRNIARSGQ